MLGLYGFFPDNPRGLTIRELLFISFVRETGAIPAVLLVTAVARMTTPVDGLVEIGMWVILLTLVIAPPLTPYVARRLGVAD
jgi:cell volume regulation protein A